MKYTLLTIFSLMLSFGLHAQCTNVFSSPRGTNSAAVPTCTDQTVSNLDPNESIIFQVTAGQNYRVSINNINWNDESVSVYNNSNSAFIGGASGGGGASFTWTSSFTGQVRVVTSRDCVNTSPFAWFNGMQSATLSYRRTGEGDPSVFGNNEWRVHAYQGRDRDLGAGLIYNGYYTETNLSYDSRNRWGASLSPANATGYLGCDPGINNHTVASKRRGFTPQYYSIDVTNQDDEAKLFVNGVEVWETGSCCGSFDCVWTGFLGATSTVEFRHAEGTGGSHQGLRFNELGTPGGPGIDEWNVYVFNAGDATGGSGAWNNNNYSGFYVDPNLNFNTATFWGTNPSSPTNYVGCPVGDDNHSWRALRTDWDCDVYRISINNHDDAARLIINGTTVFTVDFWSGSGSNPNTYPITNAWTGVLGPTDVVEFRASEGGGGSNGRLTFTNLTNTLNAGTVSYTGATSACVGYNPPTINSASLASNGASAAITNGSSSYQWQLNGVDIGGATGTTYNPGLINTPGSYVFRREVTDKCGNTALSNPITITIVADPATPTATKLPNTTSVCTGQTITLTGVTDNGGGIGTCNIEYQVNGTGPWTTTVPSFAATSGTNSISVRKNCNGTDCDLSGVNTYSWAVTPNAAITSVSGTSPLCIGATATYSTSGVVLGGGTGAWSSSNSGVATVNASGLVTAVGSGTANIVYTITGGCGGTVSAQQAVTVTPNAAITSVSGPSLSCIGATATYSTSGVVLGGGTGTWSSSNTSVATVNASGVVSAVGSGTTNIVYTITGGCGGTVSAQQALSVNSPGNIVMTNASGTCQSNSVNDWVHLYNGAGNIIASVRDNNQNIGDVTAEVFYNGGNAFSVPANNGQCPGYWQAVLNRSFVINSTIAPSSDVDVRLYFTDAELSSLIAQAGCNDPNGCDDDDDVCGIGGLYVTQISGAASEDGTFVNGDGTFTLHTPSNNGTGNATFGANYVEISVDGFSEFWIHGSESGVVLPVELLSFNVQAVDNAYIQLDWATATEINNEGFEVQRSTDGVNFEPIAFINGNGNSNTVHNYKYKDVAVQEGMTYYYQLKQIDYDRGFEYFDIKSARLNKTGADIEISNFIPNPAENTSVLRFNVDKAMQTSITVYDITGKIVLSEAANLSEGANTIRFNTSDLAAGTYNAKVVIGDKVLSRRLLINK